MSEITEKNEKQEKDRDLLTIILGGIFVLAFIVFIVGVMVRRDLLSPEFYAEALNDNNVYERVYTEVLADPALQAKISEATGIQSDVIIGELYAQVVGALYLVLPPNELESGTTKFLTGLTDYLKGDRPELPEDIGYGSKLTPELLADRITRAAAAVAVEAVDKTTPIVENATGALIEADLSQYMDKISEGRLERIPLGLLQASTAGLSAAERDALVDRLLGPVAATVGDDVRLQLNAALAADDLPSAISIATTERLRGRVTTALTNAGPQLEQSAAVNGVSALAASLGETRDNTVRLLNDARGYVRTLEIATIVAIIIMLITIALIVAIRSDDLRGALRSAGFTLAGAGAAVMLFWLIGGLVARSRITTGLAAQQGPPGLNGVVDDVVGSLARNLWESVWAVALWFLVLGLVALAFAYSKQLMATLRRLLEPVWEYRLAVLAGLFGLFVLLPLVWRLATANAREANLPCNGHVELCDRPINEIAYATSHNSMSITEYRWIWPMHDGTITEQLEYGVRALLIDSHYLDREEDTEGFVASLPPEAQQVVTEALANFTPPAQDGTYLCHQFCALGYSSLLDGLVEVRTFLENNPRELLFIVIQDEITPGDTEQVVADAGLLPYIYDHAAGAPWPTLRELIDFNKRLIIMAENEGPPPDWYTNVWDVTEETPYTFVTKDQFSCAPNRGYTGKPFFLLNHWIQRGSPNRVDAAIVNDYDFLLARAQQCAAERGKMPNFIAVNYYGQGDLMAVVDTLNGFEPAIVK